MEYRRDSAKAHIRKFYVIDLFQIKLGISNSLVKSGQPLTNAKHGQPALSRWDSMIQSE